MATDKFSRFPLLHERADHDHIVVKFHRRPCYTVYPRTELAIPSCEYYEAEILSTLSHIAAYNILNKCTLLTSKDTCKKSADESLWYLAYS